MALSIQKRLSLPLIVGAGQNGPAEDITNYSGFCVSAFFPGATGTMKLQRSNDGTNWVDIASATATFSGGHALIDTATIHAAFVRPVFDISAGAGNYDVRYLAKDF